MDSLPSLNCLICTTAFDKFSRCPTLGLCGHTVCRSCAISLCLHSLGKCAICKMEMAFVSDFETPTDNCQLKEELDYIQDENSRMKQEEKDRHREFVLERVALNRKLLLHRRECQLTEKGLEKQDEKLANMKTLLTAYQEHNDIERRKSVAFECSRCTIPLKDSTARLCLQCCTRTDLLSKKAHLNTTVEDARRHVLCGGCVLNSVHVSHTTVKLEQVIRATKFETTLGEYQNELASINCPAEKSTLEKLSSLRSEYLSSTDSTDQVVLEEAKTILQYLRSKQLAEHCSSN